MTHHGASSLVAIIAVVLVGCGTSVAPPKSMVVERTEARLERGTYLATHVTGCVACHSTRDWSRLGGPVVAGSEGQGGERYDKSMGFPADIVASNITPHALGDWSDGELERAVTAGVSKDGRPLFPVMPYLNFGRLCQPDVDAILTWTRSLKPVATTAAPLPSYGFPFSMILPGIPKDQARAAPCPQPADGAAYGAYLVTAASCIECHSQMERGQIKAGLEGAGGRAFKLSSGTVRSANITPHPSTGIGGWSREVFVARFKGHADTDVVAPGQMQSVMDWQGYAGMSESDLGAIYDHLRTLPPVDNAVERWTPATP